MTRLKYTHVARCIKSSNFKIGPEGVEYICDGKYVFDILKHSTLEQQHFYGNETSI